MIYWSYSFGEYLVDRGFTARNPSSLVPVFPLLHNIFLSAYLLSRIVSIKWEDWGQIENLFLDMF